MQTTAPAVAYSHAPDEANMPDNDGDQWDERSGWIGNRTPAEQLATLATRMFNLEREMRSLRSEVKEGRDELRAEVRGRLDELRAAKADAYRIANLESLVLSKTEEQNRQLSEVRRDAEKALAAKADAWHLKIVSVVVLGFVGIILVAVANNLLGGHATVYQPPAADHR